MHILNYNTTLSNSLMQQLLKNVSKAGWNAASLIESLNALGLPEMDAQLIMRGDPINLIQLFDDWINELVIESLSSENFEQLKVHEKIKCLLSLKFKALHPYKDAVQKGVYLFKKPSAVQQSLGMLIKTVNQMWYEAGDQSTDFNYYTKRATLSLVYMRVFINWLKPSTGLDEIDGIIDRALLDAYRLSQLKNRAQEAVSHLLQGFKR
ncbi:MAG: COQ9 family protein [Alphaproteobacteria bacterium]|nr:COQ9 family protein [Alphaproteobacteria bacterium]